VLRSSTTQCTGIHVASDGVYVVQLSRRGRRVSLARCTAVRLERSVTMPESLADSEARELLAEALRVLRRGGIDVARPYFALSGTACFIKRRFALPRSAEATREHLMWEAEQLLGPDVDEYVVDTLVTPRHGFFIAVRRQILDLHRALCRQARLGDPGFDMASFALCNALESCGAGGAGVEVILQEEGHSARAVLLRDGAYEGESSWILDDQTMTAGVTRLCQAELDEHESVPRMWLASGGHAGGFDRVDEVLELDPFAGLSVPDSVRQTLNNAEVPPRAYTVAVGLAVRGLADV
jgi:Tfp pilus assembly PilM family ATPase